MKVIKPDIMTKDQFIDWFSKVETLFETIHDADFSSKSALQVKAYDLFEAGSQEECDEIDQLLNTLLEPEQRVIFLIGLPASGKSTYANDKKDFFIVSPDIVRHEILQCGYHPKTEPAVLKVTIEILIEALNKGENIIIDATNLTPEKRKTYHDIVDHCKVHKEAVIFDTPFELIKKRNDRRPSETRVCDEDLAQMKTQWEEFHSNWRSIIKRERFHLAYIIKTKLNKEMI